MMDIDQLLSKHSDHYRFHGAGGFLDSLIDQAEDGEIRLWGRNHDDKADGEDTCEYEQGSGYLYATDVNGLSLCYDNFASSEEQLVLVLEKMVATPREWFPRKTDKRERLIRVEEWKVVGAIRPVASDEDGVIEEECISLAELLSGGF